jgi:hypothetical protein
MCTATDEAKAWYCDVLVFDLIEDTSLGNGKRWFSSRRRNLPERVSNEGKFLSGPARKVHACFHFLLFGYRQNEGARAMSSKIIHWSKSTIRDASSPIHSKNIVLGQPTVSISERTLRGSNIGTRIARQYSTILL